MAANFLPLQNSFVALRPFVVVNLHSAPEIAVHPTGYEQRSHDVFLLPNQMSQSLIVQDECISVKELQGELN